MPHPLNRKTKAAMRRLADMIDKYPPNKEISFLALKTASNLIMQELRKDILTSLVKERGQLQAQAGGDRLLVKLDNPELKFDQESLNNALKYDEGIFCVVKRSMSGAGPRSTLPYILSLLFGELDQSTRRACQQDYFHKFRFRALAWEARCIVEAKNYVQPNDEPVFLKDDDQRVSTPSNYFEGFLWAQCLREHRVLPYITLGQKLLTPFADNRRRAWIGITGSFDSNKLDDDEEPENCLVDTRTKSESENKRYFSRSLDPTITIPLQLYHSDSYSSLSSTEQVRKLEIDVRSTFGTRAVELSERKEEVTEEGSKVRQAETSARREDVVFMGRRVVKRSKPPKFGRKQTSILDFVRR